VESELNVAHMTIWWVLPIHFPFPFTGVIQNNVLNTLPSKVIDRRFLKVENCHQIRCHVPLVSEPLSKLVANIVLYICILSHIAISLSLFLSVTSVENTEKCFKTLTSRTKDGEEN
jgi:hypothetical protein